MASSKEVSIVFCKHSDVDDLSGDITSHICSAIDQRLPGQALGAQKIRGVWVIGVGSQAAADTLITSHIDINNKKMKYFLRIHMKKETLILMENVS